MAKKKILNPRPTVTQEEWEQFIDLYTRVKDIAFLYKIVVSSRKDTYNYFYPQYIEGPNTTGTYIVERGDNYEEEYVPIEFILNPDQYLIEAEKIIEEREKENATKRCNAEFHQYLKLKEKFKDTEEPPC